MTEAPGKEAMMERLLRENRALFNDVTALRKQMHMSRHGAVVEMLADAIKDVCWKATPYGTTEDGDIHTYIVPKGAMHRLIGAAQSAGISAAIRQTGGSDDQQQ